MNAIRTQQGGWFLAGLVMLALAGSSWAADDAQTRVLGNWLTQAGDGIIQISQAADGTLQSMDLTQFPEKP